MPGRLLLKEILRRDHPLSPISNRALFSGSLFLVSILVATLIVHFSENWSLVNSFYYIAMVTTTNGAPFPPTTPAVTMFTSLWAYYSFILLATTLTLAFGPLIGYLIKEGGTFIKKAEETVEEVEGHARANSRNAR